MFRALGLLGVSMFAGHAVLAWLEPAPRSVRQLAAIAPAAGAESLNAIVMEPAAPKRPWRGVQIHALPSTSRWRSTTLTAITPQTQLHFLVTADGDVEASQRWLDQSAIGGDRFIHVGLRIRQDGHPLQDAQLAGLSRLLDVLSASLDLHAVGDSLPVRLDSADTIQRYASQLKQQLHRQFPTG